MQDIPIIEENAVTLTVYDKRYPAVVGRFGGAVMIVIGAAFFLFGLIPVGLAAVTGHLFAGISGMGFMLLIGVGLCLWGRSYLREADSPDRVEAEIWQFNRESGTLYVARRRRPSPTGALRDEVVATYPLPPAGAAGWFEPNPHDDMSSYKLLLQVGGTRLVGTPHNTSPRNMAFVADRINRFLAGQG